MSKQEYYLKNNEILWTSELEEALARHEGLLTLLAEPGHALTEQRLLKRISASASILELARGDGLEWPTADTAVPTHLDARSRRYFDDDPFQADSHFALEVMAGQTYLEEGRGFNNFPVILWSEPFRPEGVADFMQRMAKNPAQATYESKPYLLRAHALMPEFMGALQRSVASYGTLAKWNNALERGGIEPEEYPADAVLLRSSRLAYGLLANLMRTDDLQRQAAWCGLDASRAPLIEDPETELRT